tara:strand:- start:2971 stop:3123 length:153 start_codon:yes stop_codon:yes gene_type:complete
MPKLDGKKYSYDEKGLKSYIKALKKKRKKKDSGDEDSSANGGNMPGNYNG